jgi:hypothetical protein
VLVSSVAPIITIAIRPEFSINMRRYLNVIFFMLILVAMELATIPLLIWMTGDSTELKFGSWQLAEWLINYEGGFVRRGLAGQLLYWIGSGSNLISLINLMTLMLYFCYFILFITLYRLAKIQNLPIFLLSILIPGGIFQMGMTAQFFTRKEILFLMLFGILCLIYLLTLRKKSKNQSNNHILLLLVALVGGIFCTFVHEGYLFMGYPITVILLWTALKTEPKKSVSGFLFGAYVVLIPLLFIYLSLHKGDYFLATQIWDSLSLSDRQILSPAAPYSFFGPIASLSWGLTQHFLTLYGIFATGAYIYWPIYIVGNVLVLGFIFYVLSQANPSRATAFFKILFLAGLCIATMFFIAADWGRWLSFLTNSLLLFSFALSASANSEISREGGASSTTAIFSKLYIKIIFIALIMYSLVFRLPECCLSPHMIFMSY